MISDALKTTMQLLGDMAKAEGVSFVGVLAQHSPDDADFTTRLLLTAVPEADISEDHVLLDAFREITDSWSVFSHAPKGE